MAFENNGAFIRNIAEVPWREFPDHFGGALSKPLVMPETANSRHIDYRISMYQPMAHVARHAHRVQEQIYHVLEGEGLMEIAGKNHVVRKHDFIFLPPGVEHAISNFGHGRSGVSGDYLAGHRRRQAGLIFGGCYPVGMPR
jgi:mannose-6-phosphate isomerase-like protein (cupin superfamily)